MKTKRNRMQLCLLVALLLPLAVQAQLTYTTNSDNTINITGYTGTPPSPLVIPPTITGLPVTSIGDAAFAGNSSLISVSIPNSVTNIGPEAFSYASLNLITVDGSNPAYSSIAGVLFNKNQTTLIQYPIALAGPYSIPITVTSIGDDAFAGAGGLLNVMIGGSITNIGEGAFSYCFLNALVVDASNSAYSSANGVLFNKNQTTLIQYPITVAGPYNIPASVTTIGDFAFAEAYNLTSVTIPNGVTEIGYSAFYDCYDLMNVTIPNSVTNIDVYAFYSCGLVRVTVGGGVTSLGYAAFADCGNLQEVYFLGNAPALSPDGVFINDPATVYYRAGTTGWGPTYDGRPTSLYLPANVVTATAAGLYHSLFIKIDGSLWSMGENGFGQLGNGTTTSANRPQLIATNVMAIAGGGFHTLFVKNDGSLWAMGDNQYGELGDGTLNNTNRPEMIVPSGVVAVVAGVYHSLFLKSDSSLWGMGYNHEGQLGDGTSGPSNQTNRPEYLDTNVMAVAAGNYHSMYLKNGSIWFMGKNDAGQLGNGSYNNIYTRREVIRAATAIAALGNHSLYLNGQNMFATGDNSQGEFGNGTYTSVNIPELIANNVTTIATGSNHTLYRTVDGILWGTGANNAGQLGDGTYTTTNQAKQIVSAGVVVAMAAGDQHSLLLVDDGSLWGMGNNSGGEMGDGTFNNTNRPEQIVGPMVANGGFEMGNFDGWTLVPGEDYTIVSGAHSGSYAAQFHDLYLGGFGGSTESIFSQTLPTQAGANYLLSFWVNGILNGSVQVSWNGNVLATESIGSGWTNLQFVVAATGANTLLQFTFAGIFFHATTTTALDDVSLTLLPPTISSQPTATMDWNDMHQRIDGFGGGVVFLDPASLDPVTAANMDTLFDTNNANQLGLTLLRIRIDPTTNWSIALLDGQKAVARGAGVLATPWTPPAGMKDNTNVIGGSLLPSQYTNYANYLNDFAAHMSSNGAPLKAISIQNEPDFVPAGYEGCGWTATQLETFCHNVAGLITNAPVLMPESFHFYQTMSDPTLNDPVAAANVSIIGGHLYGAAISDYPNAHDKGKPIWMTEDLVNDQTIASAIATAEEIHDCLTIGNMSAYIWWKCLGDANGLVNASGVPQIRGFVMAQWSRFVRPGYYRIGVTSSVAALISAYRDSASPSFAIVAINTNNVDLTNQIFTLTNFPAANFVIPWITSETLSLASQPSVAVSNSSFTCTLPALSVVTFVSPPIPQLNINRAAPGSVRVLWPATWRFVLQTNDSLASTNWANYGGTINTSNGTNSVTITPPAENLFFRLRQ